MAVLTGDVGDSASEAPAAPIPASSWLALGLLFVVYLLNFLDRTLIYILFAPIKKEMNFSELELALLGSTSFVIFYTVLGVPFGWLADRVVRKRMIAVGLVIWSIFSGLTGFMDSFLGIFLCRMMVGVGEATLGPAALSLLSDLFPPRMRATVGAIFSSGIPVGAGAAFFVGGFIADNYGWRYAFYALGFPGLALAVILLIVLKEPTRGITEKKPATPAPQGAWKVILTTPALRYLYLGYALFSVASQSQSIWLPKLFGAFFPSSLTQLGMYTGTCVAIGGLLGAAFGGSGADRFRRKSRGGRMRFTALGALICVPLWLVVLFSGSFAATIAGYFLMMGFALMWPGPAAADVQDIVGPQLRGLGVGVYFLVVNMVGYGIGPIIVGKTSDLLGVAQDPQVVRYSLLLCPAACIAAAAMLWMGSRKMDEMNPGK